MVTSNIVIISKPGNCHWYNVDVVLYHFITVVDFCGTSTIKIYNSLVIYKYIYNKTIFVDIYPEVGFLNDVVVQFLIF